MFNKSQFKKYICNSTHCYNRKTWINVYSVRVQKHTGQEKLRIWSLCTQLFLSSNQNHSRDLKWYIYYDHGLCYFMIHDPTIHDPTMHDSGTNYSNKLKLYRENYATGKLNFAEKKPSCFLHAKLFVNMCKHFSAT